MSLPLPYPPPSPLNLPMMATTRHNKTRYFAIHSFQSGFMIDEIPVLTEMQNSQVAVLPAESVKTQVTVVSPTEKKEFGVDDRLTRDTVPETSVAVGSDQVTVNPGVPSSITLCTEGGHTTVGGVVSTKEEKKRIKFWTTSTYS